MQPSHSLRIGYAVIATASVITSAAVFGEDKAPQNRIAVNPSLFPALTEPPCSYCSTQHRKGLIRYDDRVVAWLRGAHNGGAIPLRHFLSGPRVINDTYGLFFYDPDGGYVAAYSKDYGYNFHGWRNGVMMVKGPDGCLWSALSGICIDGAKKGQRLKRIPSMVTDWGYWLMLHPESTAYDLFDGKEYQVAPLPRAMSEEAKQTMGEVDPRLKPTANVLGVEIDGHTKAYPIDDVGQRECFNDSLADQSITVFWFQPTHTGVAFNRELDGRALTFYADAISPESAPIKDRETGTRWTLAGRGIDGPLRGKELRWVSGVQCHWYAWAAEYPKTELHDPSE